MKNNNLYLKIKEGWSVIYKLFKVIRKRKIVFVAIDDYAKDDGPGGSDICVVFNMRICVFEVK